MLCEIIKKTEKFGHFMLFRSLSLFSNAVYLLYTCRGYIYFRQEFATHFRQHFRPHKYTYILN